MTTVLEIDRLDKQFVLHQQGGVKIAVFEDFCASIEAGESVAVTGPSGRGKSSLLKLIYGTYRASAGAIRVRHDGEWLDVVNSAPRLMLDVRRHTIGYVTQFLRVIPRVPADRIVAEPLTDRGVPEDEALARARALLERLNIPKRMWPLSPMTFSGGEQQRVNIARGFCANYPLLLLDEPTASLDQKNRHEVLALINEAREGGTAVVAIFHSEEERSYVCRRTLTF